MISSIKQHGLDIENTLRLNIRPLLERGREVLAALQQQLARRYGVKDISKVKLEKLLE